MEEAGVSDNYSDGNKAGFLTTDCHFLYVWFPSLPPSTSSHPGSHSWTQGLGILLFINPKLFSPSPHSADPQSRCTVHGKKCGGCISVRHWGRPQFSSSPTDVIYQLFSEEATQWERAGVFGVGGGAKNKGMNGDVCWQTAWFESEHPFHDTQTHPAHIPPMHIYFIFHMQHLLPPPKKPTNT